MTNKSASKQHGLHTMNSTRPKKRIYLKVSKKRAQTKSVERQESIANAKKDHLK